MTWGGRFLVCSLLFNQEREQNPSTGRLLPKVHVVYRNFAKHCNYYTAVLGVQPLTYQPGHSVFVRCPLTEGGVRVNVSVSSSVHGPWIFVCLGLFGGLIQTADMSSPFFCHAYMCVLTSLRVLVGSLPRKYNSEPAVFSPTIQTAQNPFSVQSVVHEALRVLRHFSLDYKCSEVSEGILVWKNTPSGLTVSSVS